ncbi:TetR/AcrR family transcriptional regulator [Nocardioides jishulii]|uniref:TetR/AcrR family transcriptional regulator n=1 Tax=Nocardioides jishulii TaxID=2575440 RepID=A0A4U2YR92_9ACTN|nr:TetR/AcrR family transcriptional regulator [Nocardioides jishulii]QCX26267.1 TetR/AcrR family transcriptional regulator [Nocardioides jishulii]TKI63929.1 TetR/AcrR family transcriptional regulator [Nocardioides jishulii]
MPRPPHARDKVLAAYVGLLVEGERGATMDAVAARAGVSKGGLLYHFPSKDALAEAVLELFAQVSGDDLVAMRSAPEGAAKHFVRTSWQVDHELDPIYRAALRLAQAGHAGALAAIDDLHQQWLAAIEAEVGDPGVARTIMLIGDGLYHQTSMPGTWSHDTFAAALPDLLAQVDRLCGR